MERVLGLPTPFSTPQGQLCPDASQEGGRPWNLKPPRLSPKPLIGSKAWLGGKAEIIPLELFIGLEPREL